MNIPDKAFVDAARAIYGEIRFKVHGWSVMDRLTCESQAKRAIQAAAPAIAAQALRDAAHTLTLTEDQVQLFRLANEMEEA